MYIVPTLKTVTHIPEIGPRNVFNRLLTRHTREGFQPPEKVLKLKSLKDSQTAPFHWPFLGYTDLKLYLTKYQATLLLPCYDLFRSQVLHYLRSRYGSILSPPIFSKWLSDVFFLSHFFPFYSIGNTYVFCPDVNGFLLCKSLYNQYPLRFSLEWLVQYSFINEIMLTSFSESAFKYIFFKEVVVWSRI